MLQKELKVLITSVSAMMVLVFSCSSNTEKKHEGSAVHNKEISEQADMCRKLVSISQEKDFNVLKTAPVSIQPEDIKDKSRYQELDKAFYDRYLGDSEIVQDWIGESAHPPDLQTDHLFWGALDLDNDLCQVIIYEHFSYNGNEDRLILLNLDENREVIGTTIIAGRVSSPGGDIKYSSKIWRDRFHVFRTEKGIVGQKPGKYKYQKDSIVLKYALNAKQIELTGKDSIRKSYWE